MKTLFTIIALTTYSFWTVPVETPEAKMEKDLFFIIYSKDYDSWYEGAFKKDASRRSQYCNETLTQVGKINSNEAAVMLKDFNMEKMNEFASDEFMKKMSKKMNINHRVFEMIPLSKDVSVKNPKSVNLLFEISFNSFDKWKKNAFDKDSKRRWEYCNEYRTEVAKISDQKAFVILYQFDLTRFDEFAEMDIEDKDFITLSKELNLEHGNVSVLKSL